MNGFSSNNGPKPADPFSAFWTDLMSRMSTAGFGQPAPAPQDEMFRQMRQSFFDAWGQYCEEFMRSPAFLDGMKKTMDNTLAFRQQLNEFFTRTLHEGQIPARSDTDAIMLVLRSLEERVLQRVEELSTRVDELSEKVGRPGNAPSGPAPSSGPSQRPKGGSR